MVSEPPRYVAALRRCNYCFADGATALANMQKKNAESSQQQEKLNLNGGNQQGLVGLKNSFRFAAIKGRREVF